MWGPWPWGGARTRWPLGGGRPGSWWALRGSSGGESEQSGGGWGRDSAAFMGGGGRPRSWAATLGRPKSLLQSPRPAAAALNQGEFSRFFLSSRARRISLSPQLFTSVVSEHVSPPSQELSHVCISCPCEAGFSSVSGAVFPPASGLGPRPEGAGLAPEPGVCAVLTLFWHNRPRTPATHLPGCLYPGSALKRGRESTWCCHRSWNSCGRAVAKPCVSSL